MKRDREAGEKEKKKVRREIMTETLEEGKSRRERERLREGQREVERDRQRETEREKNRQFKYGQWDVKFCSQSDEGGGPIFVSPPRVVLVQRAVF